jgi:hypothetical protein
MINRETRISTLINSVETAKELHPSQRDELMSTIWTFLQDEPMPEEEII